MRVARDVGIATATAVGAPAADPPDAGPSVLRDCADAEAYVASVCFKIGPPRLVGVELEWLLHQPLTPEVPPDPAVLVTALGPHTPTTLDPSSSALPLPAGSAVTVEPGGQIELASPPLPDLGGLLQTVRADADALHHLLAGQGLEPQLRATDPVRPAVRILDVPRYRAMEQAFDRLGPHGRSAMCSTAAVQVCVDAGEQGDVAERWSAVHAFGPVLLAAFANSPLLHGRPTGWKSSRWACWQRADPSRTVPPRTSDVTSEDPATAWARRVLSSPLLLVRREGTWDVPRGVTFADWINGALPAPPTTADLDYHVSTLFPPVRPHGHLEVRYVDAQPGRRWALPVTVIAALLSDTVVTGKAREACEPAEGRWTEAARLGLADEPLARAAATLFELACDRSTALGAPRWVAEDLVDMTERQVLRGLCPADTSVEVSGDRLVGDPALDLAENYTRQPAPPEGETS